MNKYSVSVAYANAPVSTDEPSISSCVPIKLIVSVVLVPGSFGNKSTSSGVPSPSESLRITPVDGSTAVANDCPGAMNVFLNPAPPILNSVVIQLFIKNFGCCHNIKKKCGKNVYPE